MELRLASDRRTPCLRALSSFFRPYLHVRLGMTRVLLDRCVSGPFPAGLLLHGKSLTKAPSLLSLEGARLSMLQW